MKDLTKSRCYLDRAKGLIPSQSQTFSKGPTQFVQGVSPIFCHKAKGAQIWDVDGNRYADFIMALGPIVLGYCDDEVDRAVIDQVRKGSVFSLPHHLEVDVAEALTEVIPSAEMVRYGKNGSDVTAAAIRVSRAYTGRDHVAICGYHGWQDWCISTTTRDLGVPAATKALSHTFDYNNPASLEALFQAYPAKIACVIIEAIGIDEPVPGFLERVQQLAHKNGALLVFDEMRTGFRFALGGVQEYAGVLPDLSTWGKAIANGYPLAVICGRREIMELFDDVFFSFTFGGEAVSLAACLKTIECMNSRQVVPYLWEIGEYFLQYFNQLIADAGLNGFIKNKGYGVQFITQFRGGKTFSELELKSLFQQELIKRGHLTISSYSLSHAHNKALLDRTLSDIQDVCILVRNAIENEQVAQLLDGAPVKAIFRTP